MSTAALCRRLAEIDAAILEQEMALNVQRDRADVQRQLHATSTFPVLTLPAEIALTELFSFCLPSIEQLREDRSQGPTVFLGVCRTWRDIALGTPALWVTLSLCFDFIAEEVVAEPGAVEGFIDIWLGRAALRPLSLIFSAKFAEDRPFTRSRMRDARLEYIELETSQTYTQQIGLDSVAFPLLRRAAISDNLEPWPDPSNPVHIYRNAPQLHHLIILGMTPISCYTPPWLQLTKFEGEILNLDLFVMAPNLTESLTVSKLSSMTYDPLPYLTLPALQFLYIDNGIRSPDKLCAFLTRSSPPLRTLSATLLHSKDYVALIDFLHRRSTSPAVAKFQSFRLISPPGAFLQDSFSANIGAGAGYDEAIGHLAQLASLGINIHIRTTQKTYIDHVQHVPGDPAYKSMA
ncbi:hypothetical protein FB451DRAFT_1371156 [Mycena latifolia]|nr:hypothetical protein FB451DRAFT_1371156 [Mycena latifolia]